MQQKNTMLLIALSILVFAGWLWVRDQLWPPPRKSAEQQALEAKLWPLGKTKASTQGTIFTSLVGLGAPLAGPADVLRLGIGVTVATEPPPSSKELPRVAEWKDLPSYHRKALLVVPPAWPVGLQALSTIAHLASLQPPPSAPAQEIRRIVLGGRKHHLQAVLSARGAGVEKLTLNKFQAADWLGRPEATDLELIPEDTITPSYLFYHYPEPSAKRPVLTLGERIWKLDSEPDANAEHMEVTFATEVPGYDHLRIRKTFTLEPGAYHLGLTLEISDGRDIKTAAADPTRFRYQLAGAHGLPIEGEWYTSTFRNAVFGRVDPRNNLWRDMEESSRISHYAGGDRVPEGDLGESRLQYAGVMSQYFGAIVVVDNKQPTREEGGVDPRKILEWARATQESSELAGRIIGFTDRTIFFESQADKVRRQESFRLLPRVREHLKKAEFKDGDTAVLSFYRTAEGEGVATWVRRGRTVLPSFDDITVRVQSQEIQLRPGEKVVHRFLLYHGPVKVKLLDQFSGDRAVRQELVNRYTDTLHLSTLTDYGRFYWWSDLIIYSTKFMHWLLYHLRIFGDGISIILLTVIVRGLMFPISRKQAYFSVKMQELAPEIKKMQEKYKNDPRGKTEATMELYRKHNVHPLGGCLPIFLQMPIFIGLYFALQESIFFRLAPFLWIRNLAAPDMLIYWGESIPIISDPSNRIGPGGSMIDALLAMFYLGPYLNLLPIIAVTLMIVQQKVMTPPPQDEQQAMQFKMMRYMMIFFGLMFYKVAAGLCIYFTASSLWGLAERRFLPKKKLATSSLTTGPAPRPGPGGRKGSGKSGGKAPEKKNGQIQKVRDWWQEVLKQAKKK